MKSIIKKIIPLVAMCISIQVEAQQWTGTTNNINNTNAGSVLIGSTTIPTGYNPKFYVNAGSTSPSLTGGVLFDIPNLAPLVGDGKARFHFNRPGTTFENLISLETAGTYKWLIGMDDGSDNFRLFGPGAIKILNISTTGNFGLGLTGTSGPFSRFHMNGNALFSANDVLSIGSAPYIIGTNDFSNTSNPDYTWYGDLTTGIFHPSLGNLSFTTAGTERLTIKNNGWVGIGAPAPACAFNVVGAYSLFSSATGSPVSAATIKGGNGYSDATHPDYTWWGSYQTGIFHPSANSIAFSTGGIEKMSITNDNNVVFGNTSSIFNAAIGQAPNLDYGTDYLGFNVVHDPTNNTWVRQTNGAANGSSLIWGGVNGQISFSPLPNYGTGTLAISDAQALAYRAMRIRFDLNYGPQVIIGDQMPVNHPDFMLSVKGKIVSQSLYITQQNWADYVFDNDYKLTSLDTLENFITANHHLPNVPTTEEIKKDGNNTGETDRILLEKIEELTLYTIQLNKKIEELEKSK